MRFLIALICGLGLSACADGSSRFPVMSENQAALDKGVSLIRLDEGNISTFNRDVSPPQRTSPPGPANWNYRVGPGDILSVLVFNHPELTMPAGPQRSAAETGFRVQSDGTFFYPFVGQVQAAGLAPEQIRANSYVYNARYSYTSGE